MQTSKKISFRSVISFLEKHEWLVFVLFGVFLLRVPTLFEPHWYGDEEIYLVMGQGLRKGLVFYRDIFDHKPPLIYMLAALVQTVFWFRMLLLFVHAISVVYFARLSELLFKNRLSVMMATTLYAVLSTIPLLEGNIANGENFMTVPALIGMFLLYQATVKSRSVSAGQYFWVGVWFSLGFLVKVPVLFDFLAAGVFWWIYAQPKLTIRESISRLFSGKLCLVVLGFLVPVSLSVIYYYFNGAFEPYVRSALLQNIGYVQSWREGEVQTSLLSNPLVWRMLLIAGVFGVFLIFKKFRNTSNKVLFLGMWLLLSVYGALLSNRPYPHYLIQPLVPAVFLLGLLLDRIMAKKKQVDVAVGLGIFVLVGFLLIEVGFWHYPTVPYYQNFVEFVAGKKDKAAYEAYFPASLVRNRSIADYLRDRTSADEKIFVWGEEPAIYDLSDRLPVGRYMVSFHIRDFPNGYDETYLALVNNMPRYIVVLPSQVPEFPRLEAMIQNDYTLVETMDDALIYFLIEP